MSPQYQDTDAPAGSAQKWIESLHQARNSARGLLDKCHKKMIDQRRSIDPPAPVRRLHTALCDYTRHIGPRANVLRGGKWTGELDKVDLPQPGVYDGGRLTRQGEVPPDRARQAVDWQEQSVSLRALLSEWAGGYEVAYTVEFRDREEGRVVRDYHHTAYIPVATAELVITQLDECIDDLGWVPEERPEDVKATENPL